MRWSSHDNCRIMSGETLTPRAINHDDQPLSLGSLSKPPLPEMLEPKNNRHISLESMRKSISIAQVSQILRGDKNE